MIGRLGEGGLANHRMGKEGVGEVDWVAITDCKSFQSD